MLLSVLIERSFAKYKSAANCLKVIEKNWLKFNEGSIKVKVGNKYKNNLIYNRQKM
jgi:hypothetical protein